MKIAICPSSHGLGHTTRQMAIADLLQTSHNVTVFTNRSSALTQHKSSNLTLVNCQWDIGLCQSNSFDVDVNQTRHWLHTNVTDSYIANIASTLQGFDLILTDINPMVAQAATQINKPCYAVGNFSWSWIYSHYPALNEWAARFKEWESLVDAFDVGLGPGLGTFKSTTAVGLLARSPMSHPLPKNSVLLSFGGFGIEAPESLCPKLPHAKFVADRQTVSMSTSMTIVEGIPYPALIGGSSVIVTKPGYGIVTEAAQHGIPIVCISRPQFPESPHIERWLKQRGDCVLGTQMNEAGFQEEYLDAINQMLAHGRHPPLPMTGAFDILTALGMLP